MMISFVMLLSLRGDVLIHAKRVIGNHILLEPFHSGDGGLAPVGRAARQHLDEGEAGALLLEAERLLKFEPSVVENGTVFVNSSIISDKVQRSDLRAIYVPCLEIAQELGNLKVANMVMLGAYMGSRTIGLTIGSSESTTQQFAVPPRISGP